MDPRVPATGPTPPRAGSRCSSILKSPATNSPSQSARGGLFDLSGRPTGDSIRGVAKMVRNLQLVSHSEPHSGEESYLSYAPAAVRGGVFITMHADQYRQARGSWLPFPNPHPLTNQTICSIIFSEVNTCLTEATHHPLLAQPTSSPWGASICHSPFTIPFSPCPTLPFPPQAYSCRASLIRPIGSSFVPRPHAKVFVPLLFFGTNGLHLSRPSAFSASHHHLPSTFHFQSPPLSTFFLLSSSPSLPPTGHQLLVTAGPRGALRLFP